MLVVLRDPKVSEPQNCALEGGGVQPEAGLTPGSLLGSWLEGLCQLAVATRGQQASTGLGNRGGPRIRRFCRLLPYLMPGTGPVLTVGEADREVEWG